MPPTILATLSELELLQKWRAFRNFIGRMYRIYRTEDVNPLLQLRDFWRMRRAIGVSPGEFYRYRMWDVTRPLVDRMSFIVWANRVPLEALMNSKADGTTLRSKISADCLFRELGIATPKRLAVWCPPGFDSTANGAVHTRDELAAVIRRAVAGFVLKIDIGMSGNFVHVFTAVEADLVRHASGDLWSVDQVIDLTQGRGPWLVQERLLSHPQISSLIGADVAASLRMVTCRRASGRIFLLPATLKLPATTNGLDNFGSGNIGAAVSDEGLLGAASLGRNGPPIEHHPTTRAVIAGTKVPDWCAATDLVCGAHAKINGLRSLGWDVALTPSGPVILEANTFWGGDVIQQPGPRGLLSHGEFLEFVKEIGADRAVRLAERRRVAFGHDLTTRVPDAVLAHGESPRRVDRSWQQRE